MIGNIEDLFLFFLMYSFVGWTSEVIFAYYKNKKFVNRGFLRGPLCPIYGFAIVTITLLLKNFENNIVLLFVLSVIITSLLELITGYILEVFFKSSWWDYSDNKFNVGGKICLKFSLLWGVASVIIIKIINPVIYDSIAFLSNNFVPYKTIALQVLFIVFIFDFVTTLITLYDFTKLFQSLDTVKTKYNEELTKIKENTQMDAAKLRAEVKQREEEIFNKLTNNQKRIIHSFPNLKSKRYKLTGDFKKWIKEFEK